MSDSVRGYLMKFACCWLMGESKTHTYLPITNAKYYNWTLAGSICLKNFTVARLSICQYGQVLTYIEWTWNRLTMSDNGLVSSYGAVRWFRLAKGPHIQLVPKIFQILQIGTFDCYRYRLITSDIGMGLSFHRSQSYKRTPPFTFFTYAFFSFLNCSRFSPKTNANGAISEHCNYWQ